MIEIPDNIINQMSTDQRTSYKLVSAVQKGTLPESLQYLKCGELSHARWLTTGQRLVFLWTRKHGLLDRDKRILRVLVMFFIQFYFKLYFLIKVKHSIVEAPRHILTSLTLLRTQPKQVVKIISPYIQSGAWFAHPENLLLSLLASSSKEEREFGVNKILFLRGDNEYGDKSVRERTTPQLNFTVDKLEDLICWKETILSEPVFTVDMTRLEISLLRDHPLSVPPFSCHTQSTERCVKLTTEAAANVAGQEERDKYIKARVRHRKVIPRFETKADILKTFQHST